MWVIKFLYNFFIKVNRGKRKMFYCENIVKVIRNCLIFILNVFMNRKGFCLKVLLREENRIFDKMSGIL